ncbi:PREDICTED: uncharacterized protein LOC109220127 [Nicotiana attenuata]|uniref:uncharacterized protein LOC109220127 n=1 Tax=Nicotiana attenuata TaxID=49451 RepID=UPI0009056FEA|nr:PREDICTED: uncharacterized protein LOC109220127 [Nicotiana attenuata]
MTTVKKIDKFSSRAVPAVFLGDFTTHKGYKTYEIHTKQFNISRDVVFKEDVFLFRHLNSIGSALFTVLESSTFLSIPPPESLHTSLPSYHSSNAPFSPSLQPTESSSPVHSDVGDFPSLDLSDEHVKNSDASTRKSARTSRPPIWLKDYVTPSNESIHYFYHISDMISYANVFPYFGTALAAYSAITEPKSYNEAKEDPKWIEAIKCEIAA